MIITFGIAFWGGHLAEIRYVPKHTWIFLIFSGIATGLSWLFYFKAIQLGEVSRVAPLDKLSIVFTVILSSLFLSENISLRTAIGVLLIAAGCIFICK